MIFRFKKGTHRARPLYWLHWWPLRWNPQVIQRKVTFLPETKYWHPGEDQHDHNKLFGFGFTNPLKWSARFGWRYEPEQGKFVISAFTHRAGEMNFQDLCSVEANRAVICILKVWEDEYVFEVQDPWTGKLYYKILPKGHDREMAVLLGPYFGGNRPAPETLKIKIDKV